MVNFSIKYINFGYALERPSLYMYNVHSYKIRLDKIVGGVGWVGVGVCVCVVVGGCGGDEGVTRSQCEMSKRKKITLVLA